MRLLSPDRARRLRSFYYVNEPWFWIAGWVTLFVLVGLTAASLSWRNGQ
jgi:hypothetical protein